MYIWYEIYGDWSVLEFDGVAQMILIAYIKSNWKKRRKKTQNKCQQKSWKEDIDLAPIAF